MKTYYVKRSRLSYFLEWLIKVMIGFIICLTLLPDYFIEPLNIDFKIFITYSLLGVAFVRVFHYFGSVIIEMIVYLLKKLLKLDKEEDEDYILD